MNHELKGAFGARVSTPPRPPVLWAILLLLIGLGVLQIVTTYTVFSQTFDEHQHLASGMEWLDRHTYKYEAHHPPLARVFAAIGPFLHGVRSQGHPSQWVEGNLLLNANRQYPLNLALARLGILPFFIVAVLALWSWSRSLFTGYLTLLPVLLFVTLPPVLAHGGFATTDMALTATMLCSLLSFSLWLERPTRARSVVLGTSVALAVLSKFSAFLFLPACAAAILCARFILERGTTRPLEKDSPGRASAIAIAAATMLLVIWAGYRFSFRPLGVSNVQFLADRAAGYSPAAARALRVAGAKVPLPAPELLLGVNEVRNHAGEGHESYLLGRRRKSGWWFFFPVALSVKTPLPFLLLTAAGFVHLARRAIRERKWWPLVPAVAATALLAVCLPSRINIGVRHVLPIYPLLALVASFGARAIWKLRAPAHIGPAIVAALLGWQIASTARAHPDYLPWFNEAVPADPSRVLVDSDLDWGQDMYRLARALREVGAPTVTLKCWGSADLKSFDLPPFKELIRPANGWVAVSETILRFRSEKVGWLDAYTPVRRVGKSIRLFYIPETKALDSIRPVGSLGE